MNRLLTNVDTHWALNNYHNTITVWPMGLILSLRIKKGKIPCPKILAGFGYFQIIIRNKRLKLKKEKQYKINALIAQKKQCTNLYWLCYTLLLSNIPYTVQKSESYESVIYRGFSWHSDDTYFPMGLVIFV